MWHIHRWPLMVYTWPTGHIGHSLANIGTWQKTGENWEKLGKIPLFQLFSISFLKEKPVFTGGIVAHCGPLEATHAHIRSLQALCTHRRAGWTVGPVRGYVSVLSEHIEDMRAACVTCVRIFKGGLRSKPPWHTYRYIYTGHVVAHTEIW